MHKILNKVALVLSSTGMGVAIADFLSIAAVPDETWVKGVYVVSILAGLLWQSLPDDNDTPGPDVLEGEPMNWNAWARNFIRKFTPTAATIVIVVLLTACGTAYYGTRVCTPAYSDNCFIVEGEASRRGTPAPIVTATPDVSISVEAYIKANGAEASGAASFDPVTQEAEAVACGQALFWRECISTSE